MAHDDGIGLLLMGKKPGAPDDGAGEEGEDAHSNDLKLAAHELVKAVHEQDIHGVCSALKAAFAVIERDEEGEEDEFLSDVDGGGGDGEED